MTAPIAPVLNRIAAIESRLRRVLPVGHHANAVFSTEFDAAYSLADATYAPPAGAVGATATASTTASPGVSWTGIGSSGWVYPSGSAHSSLPTTPVDTTGPVGGPGATAGDSVPVGTPFAAAFESAAARHGVPARLLAAVGWVESRYQTDAVSGAGAQGLMQLMPFVSEAYGVNPWDPVQAIDAAARILSEHYTRFGSWDLALAAYNAGAGAVAAAGNQPPSARVAGYVAAVHERMEQM